jgi:hypothetical protein
MSSNDRKRSPLLLVLKGQRDASAQRWLGDLLNVKLALTSRGSNSFHVVKKKGRSTAGWRLAPEGIGMSTFDSYSLG